MRCVLADFRVFWTAHFCVEVFNRAKSPLFKLLLDLLAVSNAIPVKLTAPDPTGDLNFRAIDRFCEPTPRCAFIRGVMVKAY